ncbi:MAG: hypothetical protein COA98_01825 [Candidatus Neomarinimicrobiota bacterium]|jgi:NADH-quinone oxidoreductase subunit C|nr:MAG: hypothetical protein COA98_01825 [Candidatus Neomarinimicrobiota bacterium]
MDLSDLTTRLQEKFPDTVLEVSEENDEVTLQLKGSSILEILSFLKADGFNFLADLTAVDNLTLGGNERFTVVYHLLSHERVERIVVKAYVSEEKPLLPSVESLWKTADWQEREVYDLFGIEFESHPNLIRIMNPDEFNGYPLRKDFPRQGRGERKDFPIVERMTRGDRE